MPPFSFDFTLPISFLYAANIFAEFFYCQMPHARHIDIDGLITFIIEGRRASGDAAAGSYALPRRCRLRC